MQFIQVTHPEVWNVRVVLLRSKAGLIDGSHGVDDSLTSAPPRTRTLCLTSSLKCHLCYILPREHVKSQGENYSEVSGWLTDVSELRHWTPWPEKSWSFFCCVTKATLRAEPLWSVTTCAFSKEGHRWLIHKRTIEVHMFLILFTHMKQLFFFFNVCKEIVGKKTI